MKKISYVTNLDSRISSGGWSGINKNIYNQLSKYFDVEYLGPVNPPFNMLEKGVSKIQRQIGLKSDFSFFSEKRLVNVREEFNHFNSKETDAYFFFGNTPWIKIHPDKPYSVYMDSDFITYLKIFSDYSKFRQHDIKRIAAQEKNWLVNAETIFFGSNWIMNETIKNLQLDQNEKKYIVVNTGGHIPIPNKDNYEYNTKELNLLFIALNFVKKGGHDAVSIFKEIQKSFSDATLTIIGEKPPINVLEVNGVNYLGLLSKNKPEELKLMEHAFQKASFLIHPTKMDTMGAIIPEANYFGTPAIASNRFGIPDLIKNEITGLLIEDSDDYKKLAKSIKSIYTDSLKYSYMRENARRYSLEHFSWDAIGLKIAKALN